MMKKRKRPLESSSSSSRLLLLVLHVSITITIIITSLLLQENHQPQVFCHGFVHLPSSLAAPQQQFPYYYSSSSSMSISRTKTWSSSSPPSHHVAAWRRETTSSPVASLPSWTRRRRERGGYRPLEESIQLFAVPNEMEHDGAYLTAVEVDDDGDEEGGEGNSLLNTTDNGMRARIQTTMTNNSSAIDEEPTAVVPVYEHEYEEEEGSDKEDVKSLLHRGNLTTTTTTSTESNNKITKNFRHGAVYLFNNYLRIQWLVLSRGVLTASAVVLGLGVVAFVSGTEAFEYSVNILDGTMRKISTAMVAYTIPEQSITGYALTTIHHCTITPISWLVRYLDTMCDGLFLRLIPPYTTSIITSSIVHPIMALQSSWFEGVRKVGLREVWNHVLRITPWFDYVYGIIIAPISEEVSDRFFFELVWRKCSQLRKKLTRVVSLCFSRGRRRRSQDLQQQLPAWAKKPEQALLFGRYEPWMVVSSLLFAISHSQCWYGRESGASFFSSFYDFVPHVKRTPQPVLLLLPIFGAINHIVGAFFLSLEVLCPLYKQFGLSASIAVHMLWNIDAGIPIHFAVRISWFLLKRLLQMCQSLSNYIHIMFFVDVSDRILSPLYGYLSTISEYSLSLTQPKIVNGGQLETVPPLEQLQQDDDDDSRQQNNNDASDGVINTRGANQRKRFLETLVRQKHSIHVSRNGELLATTTQRSNKSLRFVRDHSEDINTVVASSKDPRRSFLMKLARREHTKTKRQQESKTS